MTTLEIVLLIGLLAGVVASVAGALGWKKAEKIATAIATGVDRVKPLLGEDKKTALRRSLENAANDAGLGAASADGGPSAIAKWLAKRGLNR